MFRLREQQTSVRSFRQEQLRLTKSRYLSRLTDPLGSLCRQLFLRCLAYPVNRE